VSITDPTDGIENAVNVVFGVPAMTVKYEDYSQDPVEMTRTYTKPSCWGSLPSSDPLISAQVRGVYRGVNLENYHKRKQAKELLPMTGYSRWDETMAGNLTVSAYYHNGSSCYGNVSCQNIAWNIRDRDPGTMALFYKLHVNENALLQGAIASSLPRLDVLTTLAETNKTLDLLLNARKRAVGLITQLQKRGWKALPRTASDLWLEWRYGWRLLGFEIEAVTKAINHPIKHLFVEGRSGESHVVDYTEEGEVFPLLHWATRVSAHTSVRHHHDISIRGNVNGKVKLQSSNVLVSPVITGWELIPYSFVLDWFVNVGDVLKSYKALMLADYTFAIGVKRSWALTGTIDSVISHDAAYTSPSAGGFATHTGETRIRMPRTQPSLLPQLPVDLTTPRTTDVAALLYSTSTSLRR
jgi:hypothetical protein